MKLSYFILHREDGLRPLLKLSGYLKVNAYIDLLAEWFLSGARDTPVFPQAVHRGLCNPKTNTYFSYILKLSRLVGAKQ